MSSLVAVFRCFKFRGAGLIMALVLGMFVAGCGATSPTATATPSPTSSPTPTFTPTSTATWTPSPTNSPIPGVGVPATSSKWEIVITEVRQTDSLHTGLDSYRPKDGYTFLVVDTSIRALTMPGSADATVTSAAVGATKTAAASAGTAAATAQATASVQISSQAAAIISENGAIHTADGAVTSGMGCAGCVSWSFASDNTPKKMSFVFVLSTSIVYQPYKLQFQDVPPIPFVLQPPTAAPVTPRVTAAQIGTISTMADPTSASAPTEAPVAAVPTVSPTPAGNAQATLQAMAAATIAQRRTMTQRAVASYTKTSTPDTEKTLNAIVGLTETSQAVTNQANVIASYTKTPTPTATATPTPTQTATPTATPTPALIAMPNPPANMVLSPANAAHVAEAAVLQPDDRPNTVAVSPDGKTLAVCGDSKVLFYDLQSLQPSGDIVSNDGASHGMSFSGDWKLLVTGGEKLHLWDPTTYAEIQSYGEGLGEFSYNFFDGPMMVISPDGKLLAVRLGNSSQVIKILELPGGRVVKTLTMSGFGMLTNLTFSPNGKTLAVAGSGIHLWDTATWTERLVDEGSNRTRHVIFSADGKKMAVMHDGSPERILVWDAANGRQLTTFPTGKQGGAWGDMAFSPDSTIIASGNDDGTVSLWDASNGHPLAMLTGHTDSIRAMTFVPNGTALVTASDDRTIRLWSLPQK